MIITTSAPTPPAIAPIGSAFADVVGNGTTIVVIVVVVSSVGAAGADGDTCDGVGSSVCSVTTVAPMVVISIAVATGVGTRVVTGVGESVAVWAASFDRN